MTQTPQTAFETPNTSSLAAAFSGRTYTDPKDMEPYLLDWRKRYRGNAIAVVEPDTANDVAAVVHWCAAHTVSVVPQGGNTGLSGGSVPNAQGCSVVVSLRRLNAIRALDLPNNTITVEAGCILQTVQDHATQHQRLFPLSLASQGSCTIGGNLSTNAGGVQVLRYGNARDLCLGLEVVTAQGEVWNGLRGLRKDNTGYDLKDLYIGAEGTLGIITAAVLKLYPLPVAKRCAWVAVQSPQQALELLSLAQASLGAGLTAFELISELCLNLVVKHFANCRTPLSISAPWYVLLECVDSVSQAQCAAAIERVLETAFETELILDAAVSDNDTQFNAIWVLRENISEAQAAEGKNIKHDIAVPISCIAQFIDHTSALVEHTFPGIRMVVFGHMGDGNLHFNVSPPVGGDHEAFLSHQAEINRLVHDAVAHVNGSISAEHGLGVLRKDEAARYKSPVELDLQKRIKHALDPYNVMNPGKLLKL